MTDNPEDEAWDELERKQAKKWNASDMAHRPNGPTIDDDIQEYKKPWVGLTDTEILNIIESDHGKFMIIKIAETKLRERNNG
jgi:hypothetical protein